jgi:homocysteine S-methyltransferase
MPRYRASLPQMSGELMLSDSGLETDLIFNKGMDLPGFASFPLVATESGREALTEYYWSHLAVAAAHRTGFVYETVTWRSTPDWGHRLGYRDEQLDVLDREAVAFCTQLRDSATEVVGSQPISGLLGPRGDGYRQGEVMTPDQARRYHSTQVDRFADTEADFVSIHTLTYPAEGAGTALAARDAEIPVVISFTVETDGRLPDGTPLASAIHQVDDETDGYPAYYAINCAHPTHFASVLDPEAGWTQRIRAIRANASILSHAERDKRDDLDAGDPVALGRSYGQLKATLPTLNVFGGCCGTDVRHVEQIARSTAPV